MPEPDLEPEGECAPRGKPETEPKSETLPETEMARSGGAITGTGATRAEAISTVFAGLTDRAGKYPSMPALLQLLFQEHGITGRKRPPMSAVSVRRYRTVGVPLRTRD